MAAFSDFSHFPGARRRTGKSHETPTAVDQLTPFFSKGVNGCFSRNLPLALREHNARLRDPSQPSPY